MNEIEIELKANSIRTDSYDGNIRKQFCEQVGIDLDYLSICICGDFQIEDVIRAYDKGSMKLEENERLKKENIEAKRIIKKALSYIPPMTVDSWTKEESNFIKRAEDFIKKEGLKLWTLKNTE